MEIIKIENPADADMIFDSHAHYDDERFNGVIDEVMDENRRSGVCGVINCAVDDESCERILNLSRRFSECYCAIGYHPENLKSFEPDISALDRFVNLENIVAIGEIGLDYYWDKENAPSQKLWFEAQLEYANKHSLPVIVHDREAHADCLEILKKHKPKGVVHCFSGSPEMAKEIIKLGMYIGIGGVVTFKNAKRCREVIEVLPKDRLLLETDAPYLAPEPYRGKTCYSGMIVRVAEVIGDIWGISSNEVLKIAKRNTKQLFNI